MCCGISFHINGKVRGSQYPCVCWRLRSYKKSQRKATTCVEPPPCTYTMPSLPRGYCKDRFPASSPPASLLVTGKALQEGYELWGGVCSVLCQHLFGTHIRYSFRHFVMGPPVVHLISLPCESGHGADGWC